MFDKNVPLPDQKEKIVSTAKFRMMEIGDSFEIPDHARGGIGQFAKQAGIKITTRLQDNGMVRVWRIS